MKAPRIQKDTSQGSKQTLLSRNKTEGVAPTSTWHFSREMCTVLSHLARVYRESLSGRQSAARKVQRKILAHQQGRRVGTVLSLAGEWNER